MIDTEPQYAAFNHIGSAQIELMIVINKDENWNLDNDPTKRPRFLVRRTLERLMSRGFVTTVQPEAAWRTPTKYKLTEDGKGILRWLKTLEIGEVR
jgi:hypothetical protein